MEVAPPTLNQDMFIAAGILLAAYVLIFSEILHRTNAAIVGAVVMTVVGMFVGFYSQEEAIQAVDANTIMLLTAMMMIVAMLRPTGGFEYVAIRIAKLARGNTQLLLVYLSLAVSVISMLLDNVTTVIIFAPLTVLITRMLNLNPLPYLMAEAMLSNIGGAAGWRVRAYQPSEYHRKNLLCAHQLSEPAARQHGIGSPRDGAGGPCGAPHHVGHAAGTVLRSTGADGQGLCRAGHERVGRVRKACGGHAGACG
ncbi:MAG: SLC13 family permease [Gammaproteobacteria bacterium]|nr:SLC13 family permease [Gammaproteobacteria bacterium]